MAVAGCGSRRTSSSMPEIASWPHSRDGARQEQRLEMHFSNVWTLSDGKLINCISYSTHAEALEAAGLPGCRWTPRERRPDEGQHAHCCLVPTGVATRRRSA